MHYEDKFVERNAKFDIVIYKHVYIEHRKSKTYDFQLCSIQNCKFFPPQRIFSILNAFQFCFGKKFEMRGNVIFNQDDFIRQLNYIEAENYYLFHFKVKDQDVQFHCYEQISPRSLKLKPHLGLH